MAAPTPDKQKRKRFAREYTKDLKGAEALVRAGFNPKNRNVAASMAAKLKAEPEVAAEIERLEKKNLEKLELTSEMVLRELKDVGLTPTEVKGPEKVKALQLLAQHLGLLINKLELTGKNGGPVEVQSVKFGDREIKF